VSRTSVIVCTSRQFKQAAKVSEAIDRAIAWRDETPPEVWKPIVQACIDSFDSPPELGELSLRLAAWDYKMPGVGKGK
jgi:hypothetical protein